MAWTYQFFVSKSTQDVVNELANALNGLGKYQALTAKMGHSDIVDGKSRGLLLYNDTPTIKTIPGLPTGPWHTERQSGSEGSFYEKGAKKLCEHLDSLTEEQAALALFSMSDLSRYSCHMGIIYPSGFKSIP
jgi:hypothetical protein